jgi:sugar phosphate isomerase/epimerase
VFTKGMTLRDETRWPAEREYLTRGVEAAAALGAPWLGLTSGDAASMEWDASVDALGRALAPVVAAGRECGVGVAIEHTLPVRVEIGFIPSFADCVDVARQLGLGVTMEFNFAFRERNLAASVAAAVADDLLAVVQVCDLAPPSTTIPDRAAIGDGVIPVARIVDMVLDAGYRGSFEVEILGPRVEEEGYEPVVTRSVERLDAILRDR